MIEVKNVEVFNFKNAIRGMRNPLDSWDKSDSKEISGQVYGEDDFYSDFPISFKIGENDKKLALKLVKSGSDHSKFMRQIFVSMDINAPLYWWKEFDTYKVGTTANSCSTMHKLGSRQLTFNDFSFDDPEFIYPDSIQQTIINYINSLIKEWQSNKDKSIWREIIQLLPSAYNQMRTWTADYAVLRNMYFARKNHKLSEWHDFCRVIEKLPYSEFITVE